MNKAILALTIMSMTLFGCQKVECEAPEMGPDVFTAEVDDFNEMTRTSMTAERKVIWSKDDRIAVFKNSTAATEYVLCFGAETSRGAFEAVELDDSENPTFTAGFEIKCNIAVYPYAKGLRLKGNGLGSAEKFYKIEGFSLPMTQTYTADSFANGAFPMVAVTEKVTDNEFFFSNVLGALKLSLKGALKVKSITVEGKNGEKLSGAAAVTVYASNQFPAIVMLSEASTEVTLDCGDGVSLNSNEAKNFFIALPPVVFEKGFTVTITDSEGAEHILESTVSNTVDRSSILVMPEKVLSRANGRSIRCVQE